MAIVVISIDRETLPAHTDEQFEEWVKFQVGHFGGIDINNPLADMDMDAMVREIG